MVLRAVVAGLLAELVVGVNCKPLPRWGAASATSAVGAREAAFTWPAEPSTSARPSSRGTPQPVATVEVPTSRLGWAAPSQGGGVFVEAGTVGILDSTLTGNLVDPVGQRFGSVQRQPRRSERGPSLFAAGGTVDTTGSTIAHKSKVGIVRRASAAARMSRSIAAATAFILPAIPPTTSVWRRTSSSSVTGTTWLRRDRHRTTEGRQWPGDRGGHQRQRAVRRR